MSIGTCAVNTVISIITRNSREGAELYSMQCGRRYVWREEEEACCNIKPHVHDLKEPVFYTCSICNSQVLINILVP